jgi:hypothetical protein
VAEAPLNKLGQVRVFTVRGADQEQTLIERMGDAEVALNIRAHARFTDRVLAAPTPGWALSPVLSAMLHVRDASRRSAEAGVYRS